MSAMDIIAIGDSTSDVKCTPFRVAFPKPKLGDENTKVLIMVNKRLTPVNMLLDKNGVCYFNHNIKAITKPTTGSSPDIAVPSSIHPDALSSSQKDALVQSSEASQKVEGTPVPTVGEHQQQQIERTHEGNPQPASSEHNQESLLGASTSPTQRYVFSPKPYRHSYEEGKLPFAAYPSPSISQSSTTTTSTTDQRGVLYQKDLLHQSIMNRVVQHDEASVADSERYKIDFDLIRARMHKQPSHISSTPTLNKSYSETALERHNMLQEHNRKQREKDIKKLAKAEEKMNRRNEKQLRKEEYHQQQQQYHQQQQSQLQAPVPVIPFISSSRKHRSSSEVSLSRWAGMEPAILDSPPPTTKTAAGTTTITITTTAADETAALAAATAATTESETADGSDSSQFPHGLTIVQRPERTIVTRNAQYEAGSGEPIPLSSAASSSAATAAASATWKEKWLGSMTKSMRDVYFLTPTEQQLEQMGLKRGENEVEFITKGYPAAKAVLYFWDSATRIVVSDIDGTITKSDWVGYFVTRFSYGYSHPNIARTYSEIASRGYKFVYLTSRSLYQIEWTRQYLGGIREGPNCSITMPRGPIITAPDGFMNVFVREMVLSQADFCKVQSLRYVASLFSSTHNPFAAGFGNKESDLRAYETVGIPKDRIFIVNTKGQIVCLKTTFQSYAHVGLKIEGLFPHSGAPF